MKLINNLYLRQAGLCSPTKFLSSERFNRLCSLELSNFRDVEFSQHTASVNSIDVDHVEGRYVLVGCSDGTLYIHDLLNLTSQIEHTSHQVAEISRGSSFYERGSIDCVKWFPLDSGLFISGGMAKHLTVWDANSMVPVDKFLLTGHINCLAMSPILNKNMCVAVATSINHINLVDLKSGSRTHELRGHEKEVFACKWSTTNEYWLASASADSKVILWDVRRAKSYVQYFDYNSLNGGRIGSSLKSHDGIVNGLSFLNSGQNLATIGSDGRLRLWDVYTGYNLKLKCQKFSNKLKKHVNIAICQNTYPEFAFVPSGSKILMINLKTGHILKKLQGHYNKVYGCTFNNLYNELYSCGNDRNVIIYDSNCRERLLCPSSLKEFPMDNALFDESSQLISGSNIFPDNWSDSDND